MQTLLVLASLAAATGDESENKDANNNVLVTDVIRFYDQDCWQKSCDAEVVSCISASSNCQHHFAPLPRLVNLMPTQGRVSTAAPVKEDDAGGGPMLGFQNVRWSELSAPEMKVIECAKQNQCAPSESYVKQDEALLKAAFAETGTPAKPSSFLEVGQAQSEGHAKEIKTMKDQVQTLKDMLASGDMNEIKKRMAEMHEAAGSMKDKLNQLGHAKSSVSDVAAVHSNRMKMLEGMQKVGVDQVAKEKQFIDAARLAMAKSQKKLLALASVQNPSESDFMELAQTKVDMDATRQSMADHLAKFKASFKLPSLLEKVSKHMRADNGKI